MKMHLVLFLLLMALLLTGCGEDSRPLVAGENPVTVETVTEEINEAADKVEETAPAVQQLWEAIKGFFDALPDIELFDTGDIEEYRQEIQGTGQQEVTPTPTPSGGE